MDDRTLGRQLVAYVDATTEPVRYAGTAEPEVIMLAPDRHQPPTRTWLKVAAAVIVLAGFAAVILAARSDDTAPAEPAPADTAPPVDPAHQAAADRAGLYFAALARGNVDVVLELSDPINVVGESEMVRWWSYMSGPDGRPGRWPTGRCEVYTSDPLALRVDCPVAVTDPVAVALGLTDLRWAVRVFDDGTVDRAAEPQAGDFGNYQAVWSAYADYLRLYEPEEYANKCDPTNRPGEHFSTNRLAIVGVCGQLTSAVSADVAAWIEAGRPDPTDGS